MESCFEYHTLRNYQEMYVSFISASVLNYDTQVQIIVAK
jgi:hypothetical protein